MTLGTRLVSQLVVAALLLAAAGASWIGARRARVQAAAQEQVATLQQQSDYWAGRYESATTSATADANAPLLVSANSAFRKAVGEGQDSPPVERIDDAIQAYASALRNDGFNHDAAYNYEYVSRLRDTLAKAKPPTRRAPRPQSAPASQTADDLPAGRTIHGRPGTHPPDTRGEEFEVITPMDYGEREAQPEATPGKPRPRKG